MIKMVFFLCVSLFFCGGFARQLDFVASFIVIKFHLFLSYIIALQRDEKGASKSRSKIFFAKIAHNLTQKKTKQNDFESILASTTLCIDKFYRIFNFSWKWSARRMNAIGLLTRLRSIVWVTNSIYLKAALLVMGILCPK